MAGGVGERVPRRGQGPGSADQDTATPDVPAAPKTLRITNAAAVRLVMNHGQISINGTELRDSPTLKDFEKFFGEADRASDGVYRLHTYDKFGFVAYEEAENGNSSSKPPSPLEADCLEIFETGGPLLAPLGYPVFDSVVASTAATDASELFYCTVTGIDGRGLFTTRLPTSSSRQDGSDFYDLAFLHNEEGSKLGIKKAVAKNGFGVGSGTAPAGLNIDHHHVLVEGTSNTA